MTLSQLSFFPKAHSAILAVQYDWEWFEQKLGIKRKSCSSGPFGGAHDLQVILVLAVQYE
jgi:hypothetical protein